MVHAARETGKLLQIGHQRRSHPRYLHCFEKLIKEAGLLGRIVTVNGQWNRAVKPDLGWPRALHDPRRTGSRSTASSPWSSSATGAGTRDSAAARSSTSGRTRSTSTTGSSVHSPRAWWPAAAPTITTRRRTSGTTRSWRSTTTTPRRAGPGLLPDADHQRQPGLLREFHGRPGHAAHLGVGSGTAGLIYRDVSAPAWDAWIQKGYVSAPKVHGPKPEGAEAALDVRESVSPDEHRIPIVFRDPYHKPHLENFFNAIRGTAPLNCPAEVGYETAVTVLKVNEAVEANSG